jgi:hypothetical protein
MKAYNDSELNQYICTTVYDISTEYRIDLQIVNITHP